MLRIDTAREFRRHGYRLAAWCPICRRWADIDLEWLELIGHGDRPLSRLTHHCIDCGARGELQVRPPAPQISDGMREHLFAGSVRSAG